MEKDIEELLREEDPKEQEKKGKAAFEELERYLQEYDSKD
jgi:hypothetical protein